MVYYIYQRKGDKKMEKIQIGNYNSQLTTKMESEINGHGVWYYVIESPIGQIDIVEYEAEGQEIKRFLFDRIDSAEKKYYAICKKVLTLKPYVKN